MSFMLKAGFARIDITPPFGTDISGYFRQRLSDGILDPLYLNALAVSNGDDTVVFIAADLIGVAIGHIKKIKAIVTERTGLDAEHIYLGALHQHTATGIYELPKDAPNYAMKDKDYMNVLFRKYADAAKMALDDMSEATMGYGEKETAEPIAFVRRYFGEDGNVYTNPKVEKIVARCAEADNTVRLVRFYRKDAKDIAFVNFSTHPDVIGGNKYSADWPGFVRTYMEKDLGVNAVFFTGCQGDSNHIDFFKPPEERRSPDRYGYAKHMGRVVADAAEAVWDDLTPIEGDDIAVGYEELYERTNAAGAEKYDECKKWYEDYEAGRLDYYPTITERTYNTRIIKLRTAPVFRPLPLTAVRIGGLVVFGFGGEAFTAYGQKIRDMLPGKRVICTVCTNGHQGYLPTAEAFAQGGYEATSSMFPRTLEEDILAGAEKVINRIK